MGLEVKTRVIKRNGEEVDFRLEKIVNAIKKANEEESKVAEYVTLAISCALFAGLIAVAATILVRKKKAQK